MISEKANKKLLPFLAKVKDGGIETLVKIIASRNIVIEDITRKGELIIKHLDTTKRTTSSAPEPVRTPIQPNPT